MREPPPRRGPPRNDVKDQQHDETRPQAPPNNKWKQLLLIVLGGLLLCGIVLGAAVGVSEAAQQLSTTASDETSGGRQEETTTAPPNAAPGHDGDGSLTMLTTLSPSTISVDNQALYAPFINEVTAPFEPYFNPNADDRGCLLDSGFPHYQTQCECFNEIRIAPDQTRDLYERVRTQISIDLYGGNYAENPSSCAPSNKALWWLSSGDTRDSGDFFQRYLLALLYQHTNGSDWDSSELWLSEQSECLWIGVECNAFFRVTGLSLNTNSVQGPLPTELANLRTLRTLSLSRNHLSGMIPSTYFDEGNLGLRLESLYLYANRLSGEVPSTIGLATRLQHIKLDNNDFTGTLASEISSLTQLRRLEIAMNNFTGTIMTEFGLMTALNYLSLESNGFSGTIPTELGYLVDMTHCALNDSRLTGTIPTELGHLTVMKSLTIDKNSLTGTSPQEVCNLRNMMLDVYVTDCPDGPEIGIQCARPACCTSCRRWDIFF